jgi:hypothetical protein
MAERRPARALAFDGWEASLTSAADLMSKRVGSAAQSPQGLSSAGRICFVSVGRH